MLNHYRDLLAFRRRHSALTRGDITFLKVGEPILAFVRHDDTHTILCVFNLSPTVQDLAVEGLPNGVRVSGQSRGAELNSSKLELAGNGFAFIECGKDVDPDSLSVIEMADA